MIRLCYSNQIEALLDALAAEIAQERRSVFDPISLVVPNPLLSHFVKQGLARRLGIAANIEVAFLRGFLSKVAEASAPERPIASRDVIEGELLALFHDSRRLASRDLEAVRAYISAQEAGATASARESTGDRRAPEQTNDDEPLMEEGRDRRRVQLAATLAGLFDEYAFSRPEMLAAWRAGALVAGVDEPLQRWQRELWLALFGRTGTLAARGATSLPDLFATVPAAALRVPARVHVFGISYVARLYRQIFGALSRGTCLFVYTINPCREFWEDLEPGSRRKADPRFPRRRHREQLSLNLTAGSGAGSTGGPAGAAGGFLGGFLGSSGARPAGDAAAPRSDENPLLALWGRPGRDNIRLMNQLVDCDFDARFVDPAGDVDPAQAVPPLLLRVQQAVLDRRPLGDAAGDGSAADQSITITPAPDPRRELETIASEIWKLIRADGPRPLRMSDVAVVIAPSAAPAYLPLAGTVFRDASNLPHTVLDLPSAAEARVNEAVGLLLALPGGSLARPDLLRLCMHPLLARRFPEVDPETLIPLCEELGIVSGADRSDHAGSYLEHDRVSWSQGLTRLGLGAFLSGPRSGEERAFVIDGETLLPAELPAGAEPAARALGALARALLEYAQAARRKPATIAAHLALVRATIASLFVATTPEEESALGDVYATLDGAAACVPADFTASFRIAAELARARLGQPTRGSHRPSEGVTVASMVPMRALPFRVVFVAGLGERQFPTGEGFPALDLRAAASQPGDVSPREQDEYMFLETLLSTRERLYLSYVARDPSTGDVRGPSSTVVALLDAIGAGTTAGSPLVRPMPPLLRHEDDDLCAVFPAAARERQAAALGRSLREVAGTLELPSPSELRDRLAPDIWSELAPMLGWRGPPASTRRDPGGRRLASGGGLSWTDLRLFLQCPLQGSVRVLLPMRGDDEAGDEAEAALREHERLDELRHETVPLLRGAIARAFDPAAGSSSRERGSDAALAAAYDAEARLPRLEGTLPGGVFGATLRERHLALLRCWRDALVAALGALPDGLAPIWFGGAPEHRHDARIEPAVPVSVSRASEAPVTLELGGVTELLAGIPRDGATTLSAAPTALTLVASATRDYPERDLLRGWVTHLALAASGVNAGRPLRAVVIRPADNRMAGAGRSVDETFPALTIEEARAHLATLTAELLGDVHDYLLPCEGVFTWRRRQKKGEAMSIPAAVRLLRDDGFTRLSSDRGPVPDARRYRVPPDDVAEAMVARRFGPFFAALAAEESNQE